jgi:hypothetical protein
MGVLIVLKGELPPPIIGLITGGLTGSGYGGFTGVEGVYSGLTGVDENRNHPPIPLNCWQMNQKTM